MPKLSELLAQKAALDRKIDEVRRAERAEAIAQIRALMDQYGLTLADLGGRGAPPGRGKARPGEGDGKAGAAGTAGKASRRAGKPLGKVAPKYRDAATGATWSGRGLKPKWLAAALAAGRTLDEFRI